MKKIAILNSGIFPIPAVKGGAVENLIQLLLDVNEKNPKFEFTVFSIYDKEAIICAKKYTYANFIFINLNSIINIILLYIFKFLNFVSFKLGGRYFSKPFCFNAVRQIKKMNFDFILLEGATLFADYIKRETKITLIQRIHNIPERNLCHWDKLNADATDVYLCISKFIYENIKKNEAVNSNNVKTFLWYNSINHLLFEQRISLELKKKIRYELRLKMDDILYIYTGRIQPYKGVKELLLAFSKIDNQKAKLLIVGSSTFSSKKLTPYVKEVLSIAKTLSERIIFTGYIDYNEMYKYYQIADVAVFPSIWEEPFALTCLEAITSGLPVIITESGGMSEIVDSSCSIVVCKDDNLIDNLKNAITTLTNKSHLIKSMGRSSYKRSNKFHDSIYFDSFISIVDQVLKEKK